MGGQGKKPRRPKAPPWRRAAPASETDALVREAKGLLARGQCLTAYDRLSTAVEATDDPRAVEQLALALCELRDPARALEVLDRLARAGHEGEEMHGIRARALKDIALAEGAAAERSRALERAYRAYADGYRRTGAYWLGINAATLAALRGRRRSAKSLARRVTEHCEQLLPDVRNRQERYWVLATLGEAALVLEREPEALAWYARAGRAGRGHWRNLKSTRANARLLLEAQHGPAVDAPWEAVTRALPIPPLGICVGHLIDKRGRAEPRFPPRRAAAVKKALGVWIRERGIGFGTASLAAGADLLFLEALEEAGGEAHVLLPYPAQHFAEDSVAYAGHRWLERFHRLLAASAHRSLAAQHRFGTDSPSYEYANAYLDGIGRLQANALGVPVHRVAVWDGRAGDGPGGTAHMVKRWRDAGATFDVIDPGRPDRGATPWRRAVPIRTGRAARGGARVVTALFADAVGFSRLSEAQVEQFIHHFLGRVAKVMKPYRPQLRQCETWGDGLFFALEDVATAGRFALDLRDAVDGYAWERHGLPTDMNLRIALHAGPARFTKDPITLRQRIYGTHVSHAARIEPITPPGNVYASEAYAALLAAAGVEDVTCAYVGITPWAKQYGDLATYRIERSRG
ncbi:MAG: tetratricopeptide repeat-containing protein [Planctomycetota bacterium]|jgi:class 3 adenylate cyclase